MLVRVYIDGRPRYIESPATAATICGQAGVDPAQYDVWREARRGEDVKFEGVHSLVDGLYFHITPRYITGG